MELPCENFRIATHFNATKKYSLSFQILKTQLPNIFSRNWTTWPFKESSKIPTPNTLENF